MRALHEMLSRRRSSRDESGVQQDETPWRARPELIRVGGDLEVRNLTAGFGKTPVIEGVSLRFKPNKITTIIGPSGCGKTTFLRSLNRLHEDKPGANVSGRVLLDGYDIYDPSVDVIEVRRLIGLVLQTPTPFPTMSIVDNVVFGLRAQGRRVPKDEKDEIVKQALTDVALWDEVKSRLNSSPMGLSGGQQQRLCIARSIIVNPEILLMDEPTGSLDPVSQLRIEDVITNLRKRCTIIIVTHDKHLTERISDETALMWPKDKERGGPPAVVAESGPTLNILQNPKSDAAKKYFGGQQG